MKLKPIETVWDGHRFRSRLEARWAVFFDYLGFDYEYEPEGFELPSGRWYLPDFYLPDAELYVEVKGNMADKDGISRALEFDDCGAQPLIIVGPKDLEVSAKFHAEVLGAKADPDRRLAICGEPQYVRMELLGLPPLLYLEEYEQAQRAAQTARFEHGEAPTARREALRQLRRKMAGAWKKTPPPDRREV